MDFRSLPEAGALLPGTRRPEFPTSLTPCIGRGAELALLREQLGDPGCRLITLVGSGGLGKSRLALELGQTLLREPADAPYARDGIAFAALAGLTPGAQLEELLATTIAEAAGYTFGGSDPPTVQLRRFLRERSMLLVLDNLEQIPAAAPVIASMLHEAPGLKVLATSRERLKLRGERIFELQPLAYPAPDGPGDANQRYSAVELFWDTARSLTPDLQLDDQTQAAVFRICQLVDGLPLGIELAASWTRVLSCSEIAEELARNLGVLDATLQDTPARHRSLRAVFDASWELLDAQEQQTLSRLGVFRSSFDREAAAAVAGATLPLLMALNDKSLLRRLPDAGAGGRYAVPEVLRQFAYEQLQRSGDAAATADRYAAYFLERLFENTPRLRGGEQQATLAAMAVEIDHLRAAWRRASEQRDSGALVRASDSLFHFYDMRSWFSEGAAMFGSALAALPEPRVDADKLAWSKLLARQAWFIFHLGRQREAQALLEQSLATLRQLGVPGELVFPLNYLAVVCSYLGEYQRTDELCAESLALTTELDDRYGRAVACNIMAQAAYDQAYYALARSWSEQSRAIEQQLGNRWSMAYSLTNLGRSAFALHDYATARSMFEQSLAIRQEMGDMRGVATSLNRLGDVAAAQDRRVEAAGLYAQSMALSGDAANPWGVAASLINLGQLAGSARRDAAAARLLNEALRLARETQALPQLLVIVEALTPLLGAGDTSAAATALKMARSRPHGIAGLEPELDRLQLSVEQAYSSDAGEPLSLEQALEDVKQHADRAAKDQPPLRPKAPGTVALPAGLTAREVEVLRLVAQGLTDKQVAEQLVVSPRTVTSHLTSIYGKLNVNTRSAATRFAVENGLL